MTELIAAAAARLIAACSMGSVVSGSCISTFFVWQRLSVEIQLRFLD
jgi:hypothetical protein